MNAKTMKSPEYLPTDVLAQVQNQIQGKSGIEAMLFCIDTYAPDIACASSLGLEDQVLTDIIRSHKKDIRIFTLDTGRLHTQTYELIEKTNTRYDMKIDIYFPQSALVERMTSTSGMFSFYESIEKRKECCHIRKIDPLQRALKGLKIWITGIRRMQSVARNDMSLLEWDTEHNLMKLNPLIHWTENEVWEYIKEHKVPYNTLHDSGYASIGCAPCTRAIKKGEDMRSGRWWWEDTNDKECGLHTHKR